MTPNQLKEHSKTHYFKIKAKQSGKFLDVLGQRMGDGDNVGQWAEDGLDNQNWYLIPVPALEGATTHFNVMNMQSGKFLDVLGQGMNDEDNVGQWFKTGLENQMWEFIENGADGYYNIKAKHSGKFLDVLGQRMGDGDNVGQWAEDGLDNQVWQLQSFEIDRFIASKDEIDQLIRRFGPIVYFHPDEQYLPTSVETFLGNALLMPDGSSVTVDTLPQGSANIQNHQLVLRDPSARGGDLQGSAKAYIIARDALYAKEDPDPSAFDIQFWFLYGYNGPATARVKLLQFIGVSTPFGDVGGDQTISSGNSSLAPMGEHEGDWENVILRFDKKSRDLNRVFFSQHSGGDWEPAEILERANERPSDERIVIYSSLNGHASYPFPGSNYSEHRKESISAFSPLPQKIEFYLVNAADKGKSLDCSSRYELISTQFSFPIQNAPVEPKWLHFFGRWGSSKTAHFSEDAARGLLRSLLGPILGEIVNALPLTWLIELLANKFATESQDGPNFGARTEPPITKE